MELRQGPVSLVQLIAGGFRAANAAFDTSLALALMILFINILIVLIGAAAPFVLNDKIVLWVQLPLFSIQAWTILLFLTASIHILASKLESEPTTASDSLKNAVVPAMFLLISLVIVLAPVSLLSVGSILTRSLPLQCFMLVVLPLSILPFVFTLHIETLRQANPLSALRYSWALGTRHYIRVFVTVVSVITLCVALVLAIGCLLRMTGLTNPFLHWTKHVSGTLIFLVFVLLALYLFLAIEAIFTALFLNLDYMRYPALNKEQNQALANIEAEAIDSPKMAEEVGLTQTSVHTHSNEDTLKDLDKVYNAQDHLHLANHKEEDRMPTILFDDDMAEKLSKTDPNLPKPPSKAPKPPTDEQGNIKISDKKL